VGPVHRADRAEGPVARGLVSPRHISDFDQWLTCGEHGGNRRPSRLEDLLQRLVGGIPTGEVFPQVSHRTCGGGPWRSSNWTKSLSFVMTTAFAERADSKIAASAAWRSPRSRTGTASTRKTCRTQVANAGDNCASSQIVTERDQAATKGWPRRRLASRRQAVMSSDSRSGSSARTCSRDRPLARRSRTSETRIRMPLMHGRPPHCSGFTVIRSSSVMVAPCWRSGVHRTRKAPGRQAPRHGQRLFLL
jgi:hypothetical protein